MGIGEAVKKGFSVAKQSFNLVLVLFVFGAAWNIVSIFINPNTAPGTTPDTATTVRALILGLFFILASIYVQAGSLGFVAAKLKEGQADFSKFLQAAGRSYLRLLLLGFLIGSIAGILIVLGSLAVTLFAGALNIIGVILALLLAAAGIYFALLFFLAPYAIVADNEGVMPAVKKSMGLVKQNIGRVLGTLLVLILIGFGIGLVLGLVFALVSAAIPGQPAQIIFGVLSSFVNAYLGVVVTASFMSLYFSFSHKS